jgi:hypothetical protein
MGDAEALQLDLYSESRGILPRLLEDMVEWGEVNAHQTHRLTCSYI